MLSGHQRNLKILEKQALGYGDIDTPLRLVNQIDSEKKKTFKNYNLRAQLYYDKMDYEKC